MHGRLYFFKAITRVAIFGVMRIEPLFVLLATAFAAGAKLDNRFFSIEDIKDSLQCPTLDIFANKWPGIQILCDDIKRSRESVAHLSSDFIKSAEKLCDRYRKLAETLRRHIEEAR